MRTTTKLLCAAVLAMAGTSQVTAQYVSTSQVADVSELTDGYYVIKGEKNDGSDGNTGFIYYQTTSPNYKVDANKQSYAEDEKPDLSYVWKLTWSGEGENRTFTLRNAESGRYFAASNSNTQTMAGSEAANLRVDVQEESQKWFLGATNYQVDGQYLYVTINSGQKLGWWSGFANAADAIVTFYKVDGLVDVPYKYNVTNVGISFEQTASAFVGDAYTAPAVNFYTITAQPGGTVTGEETESVVVNCTASYPGGLVAKGMTADGQFASDAKWYTLSVRDGQAVVATDDAIYTKNQTRQLAKGNMWTFVKEDGNPDGFKVYNLLKGAASPLYMANNGGNNVGNTVAAFGTGSEETGTSTFLITTNGDGFNLQYPGTPNANLGDHGSGGVLAVWNDGSSATDGGSRFAVAEVNDLLDAATAQEYPGYVGSLLPEAIATLNSAKDAFAEGTETTQKLTAFIDTYNSESSQLSLTDGGYYRIQNTYTGNFLTADASLLKSQSRANGNASQIWKIERTDEDTYRLTAQGVTPAQATTEGVGSTVTMGSADGETVMTLHIGHNNPGDSGNLPANLKWFFNSDAGNASTTQTSFYSNVAGNVLLRPYTWGASIWNIQEATTLDFTVSDAGYATAHFAFPVRMDEGMTAYVAASREDNVITLTEIENGEVPAMTPVVIAAKPATYTLDILAEAPADVESNLLSGSLLPYDIQESPAYIFGVDEAGIPTFYGVADDDSSQLGANKAYFAPQGDSAASRYILRFGNEGTTGIQGVGTADEAESETYYDLSGRRVLYPAKGIYVTGSGKKVFLK